VRRLAWRCRPHGLFRLTRRRASRGCFWRSPQPPITRRRRSGRSIPGVAGGGEGYQVVHPDADTKRGYRCICDVSGDGLLIDQLVSLDGLITHRENPHDATAAYRTAFTDPDCLKMVFNWSNAAYPSAG